MPAFTCNFERCNGPHGARTADRFLRVMFVSLFMMVRCTRLTPMKFLSVLPEEMLSLRLLKKPAQTIGTNL